MDLIVLKDVARKKGRISETLPGGNLKDVHGEAREERRKTTRGVLARTSVQSERCGRAS